MSAPTLTDAEVAAMWDETYRRVPPINGRKVEWSGHRPIDIQWHVTFANLAFARGVAAVKGVDPEFKVQYERLAASQDAVKREAAREALTRLYREYAPSKGIPITSGGTYPGQFILEFRDRECPAPRPAPPTECRLSDGTMLRVDRKNGDAWIAVTHASGESTGWFTPAEFDIAIRAYTSGDRVVAHGFAAAHTEGSTDGR